MNKMVQIIEKIIIIEQESQIAIDAISSQLPLSKQVLKSAMDKGCVWLKRGKKINRLRRVKKPLNIGDKVFVYFNEKILSSVASQPQLLLDKNDYSVWFKPAGVFSQGSKWGDHCALTRLVEKKLDRPTFLVHRLDRATSGLMLIAHTKNMARDLSKMFADRNIDKTYLAIVEGKFTKEKITLEKPIDGKNAVSHVTLLESEKFKSLLKVKIETGRKHQIRKHLSEFSHPIIGDRLYGNAAKNHPEDLQLQAIQLIFNCPIDKQTVKIKLNQDERIKL
ncbi:RluA family pseudouridine synthase [uncultured Candidatus Thioglobus sp.]|jgi:tRNA pseudouridine32 synthase/23S rRNA pseudouridine746 synthase|uniref:RluA family pseudouridine synthase n=2 Tax=Candidatus Thioglobus TaxID=655184 RepID=UPI0001BD3650|nr:MAG: pseudouridylate synthase, 23S RNA-specific [uncultured Candidatus Thioglobus sp.]MBT3431843.1 RluA family pseudouridine synthase [Candidatus Thioglobus sp.]MBT4315727.1 RluA family pseudouridine synthase [Candidatus Thioglobus sp.]MBT4553099.1 RluA family pseudouridine synthase [Candidatus Thioglobus sp.]MBT4923505.1 RluA family pseudouridine synthase [Candidatus Thioglobus sp.]